MSRVMVSQNWALQAVGAVVWSGLAVLIFAGARLLLQRRATEQIAWDVYDSLICEAADRHQVPRHLVKAVMMRESAFQPAVCGGHGEVGLMQITAGAVAEWEKHRRRRAPARGMLFDPALNIEIGTWYLARGLRRWQGYEARTILALAHYNAGPGRAAKWAPDEPRAALPLQRIGFPSTREYISRVLQYQRMFVNDEMDDREAAR